MKWRAFLLVSMMIVSALFVGTAVRAQPYSGTIILMDSSGHVQDYFDTSDSIYFGVTVLDNSTPLQYQNVNVIIYGLGGIGIVFNETYTTDSYGQFDGYQWDEPWNNHDIGDYIMYVNYSGQAVTNATFKIYDPVPWSATGWTSYYGDNTDIFTENQQVEVNVQVDDQFGNPFDGGYGDVWYQIIHNGNSVFNQNLNTNNTGEDSGYFYPANQYSDQFGSYMVTIYNNAIPAQAIGFLNFTIILPNRAWVWPQNNGDNRTVFKQGEWVGFEVWLFHSDIIPYDSDDYAARILLFRDDNMVDPLENDTLRTDYDGSSVDYNYYHINYGDEYKGTYYIRVYNHTWDIIGTGIFMVIDIDTSLIPYKSVYAQEDQVQVSVSTSLDEAYTVRIDNHANSPISGASWDVPAGTHEWRHDYTFPNVDDGTYYVNVYMGSLLLDSMPFDLKKLNIDARLSQEAFLPGQSGTVFWRSMDNHDGGPISISGDTQINYMDNTFVLKSDPLSSIHGTSGSFGFTVPSDAIMGYGGNIEIDAADSAGHTDSTTASFDIGSLNVAVTTDRTTYRPGEPVYMTFDSTVSGTSAAVPNVQIRARAQRNGVTVGDIWTITTDNNGMVNYVYNVPADADTGLYIIVLNATFNDNRNVMFNGTSDFTVSDDPVVSITLFQELSVYSPGDAVNVPYRVLRDGQLIYTASVSFEARIGDSWDWGSANTIALGYGNNGTIHFTLPVDVEGKLFIQAMATIDDGLMAFDQLDNIEVSNAQLTLFTSKSIYLPGENIIWKYVLRGDTETGARYRITDPSGIVLAEGVPENDSFVFRLPDDYAQTPTATVYVTGAADTYIVSDNAAVYEGYIIEFRILRSSYKPGAIMEINYTISKVGHGPEITNGHMVQIMILGEYTDSVWVTDDWGVISYQLPETITDGRHIVMVSLTDAPQTFADTQTLIIDSDAGELAHGTIAGMNAGAFLVLILALVALIIAIIGIIKWRVMSKTAEPVQETTPPPAPESPPVEETVFTPAETYPAPDSQAVDYPPPPPPEDYTE